jgi:hypothetical protein
MEKIDMPSTVGQRSGFVREIRLPAHIRADIDRGQRAFAKHGQYRVVEPFSRKQHTLTSKQKIKDFRERWCNFLAVAAKDIGGQPPMVERLRAAVIIVDYLETQGVRFAVGRNSRMNKILQKLLNEQAAL